MFLLKALQPGTFRRNFTRNVFALFFLLCLFTFKSCSIDGGGGFQNTHFIPAGEWSDEWGSGYNITDSALEYYTADMEYEGETYPGLFMKGDILAANDFSNNAGVLLIKITEIDNIALTVNKYTGIYYKDYTSSHVLLANAINEAYEPIETDTLAEAENLFTVDNADTHVANWGSGYRR